MTDYTKSTNFASKDSLPAGSALKIVRGTEIDTEFNNLATAIATKSDKASPTFTGTVTVTGDETISGNASVAGVLTLTGTSAARINSGTTAQRPASPANGDIRYNSTINKYEGYSNGAWGALGGGATGGGSDAVFFENSLSVTSNYTVSSGKSAHSAGPITVATGVSVTIPSGSRWVIL